MEYKVSGNDIIVYQKDFALDETLDCGQAFRWERRGEQAYSGFMMDKPLELHKDDGENTFVFENTSEEDFLTVWRDYFDFDRDYGVLKEQYSRADKTLAAACAYAGGIRLLRQEPWEALCSFIISQNNNIPRIKGIIGRLCGLFGHFPTAAEIAAVGTEGLSPIRSGFRAKYISDAAHRVASGEIDLATVAKLPLENAREALKQIYGVGAKVAECELLYGMHRLEAFPVDVWIKRVLAEYYPCGFPQETAETAGIAQQYLFHYIRNNYSGK